MRKPAGVLLAAFILVANSAASAKVQPPASCKGALANRDLYAAVREAAQATVNRLEGREVTFRDILHELHNNILNASRTDPVVQNRINKLRSQLFDEIARQTTSPLGQQIKACFPMLDELLHARERAAEQKKREEEEEKKADPSSCLGALTDPEGVMKYEKLKGDCGILKCPGSKFPRQIAARLENPRLQAMAKEVADALGVEPLTAGDLVNPDPNLARRVKEFQWKLGAKLNDVRDTSAKMLFFDEFSWIQGMTQKQAFACFPVVAKMARSYEARVDEAQEAASQREQEEAQRQREQAERAKLPVNALGNAYAAYIDVKRCYEAREGYLQIYISDPEMERAKNAVRQIEETVKPKLDPITAENLWSRVQESEGRNFNPSGDYLERVRALCRERLGFLLQTLQQQVPESGKLEKDF